MTKIYIWNKNYYYYNLFILLKFWFNLSISTVIKEIYLFQLIFLLLLKINQPNSDAHIIKDLYLKYWSSIWILKVALFDMPDY